MNINYYYEGMKTPELEELFEKDPILTKFVNEICFNFPSLRIAGLWFDYTTWVTFCGSSCGLIMLKARVGKAKDVDSDKDEKIPNYMVYTPCYEKQRGRSERARRTLSSMKLSSLIATMKRNNVVLEEKEMSDTLFSEIYSELKDAMTNSVEHKGHSNNTYKSSSYCDEEVYHTFLKIFLEGKSQDLLMQHDMSKLKRTLEEYNAVDKYKEDINNLVNTMLFGNEHYGIGIVDDHKGDKEYIVTKFRFDNPNKGSLSLGFMKRVKSINESYNEFVPFLTMVKVALEAKGVNSLDNPDNLFIPNLRRIYDSDLEISSFGCGKYGSHINWIVFPCSAI